MDPPAFSNPPADNPAEMNWAVPAYQSPEALPVSSSDVYLRDDLLTKVAFDEEAPPGTLDSDYQPASPYIELTAQPFASLEEYLAQNPAQGYLTVNVVAGESGRPVPGAGVQVTRVIAGVNYLFYETRTDQAGRASQMPLPAPEKQSSFAPPQGYLPYAQYRVTVTHPGDAPVVFEDVAIFADTESVQVARLGPAPAPVIFDEGQYTR